MSDSSPVIFMELFIVFGRGGSTVIRDGEGGNGSGRTFHKMMDKHYKPNRPSLFDALIDVCLTPST